MLVADPAGRQAGTPRLWASGREFRRSRRGAEFGLPPDALAAYEPLDSGHFPERAAG